MPCQSLLLQSLQTTASSLQATTNCIIAPSIMHTHILLKFNAILYSHGTGRLLQVYPHVQMTAAVALLSVKVLRSQKCEKYLTCLFCSGYWCQKRTVF